MANPHQLLVRLGSGYGYLDHRRLEVTESSSVRQKLGSPLGSVRPLVLARSCSSRSFGTWQDNDDRKRIGADAGLTISTPCFGAWSPRENRNFPTA